MTTSVQGSLIKQEYVVGFNFVRAPEPNATTRVVLIRKRRPEWQAGKLNGIGGHVEPGETPLAAMAREYLEETGERIFDPAGRPAWELFLTQEFDEAIVHFFKSENMWTHARTMTDEEICVVALTDDFTEHLVYLPNLCWLLPMALHTDDGGYLRYKSCTH